MNTLVKLSYFVLIGWWAAIGWILLSLGFCITIIGFPLGIKMLQYTPRVAWLEGMN